ncbi:MAG: putative DNA modification/repair radical SAM protein [Candidatus Diapherotrites archaeon]|nr:putative DNA modification/repair radical SAM protein [Candidatus Diapherotrites archaeon]
MNTLEKLKILGGGTKWDVCTPARTKRALRGPDRIGAPYSAGVCRSFTPDGKCVSLLKVLQTNACVHDCKYCIHSTGCKKKQKTAFEAKELADLFMQMYVRNYVEGLFLSSGVCGSADVAAQKMLETVSILRGKYNYQGYIHLKIMPGAHPSDIKALAEHADRVSLNLEAPTKSSFSELCTTKDYQTDVLRRLSWIEKLKGKDNVTSGVTTQLVVGAGGETDLDYINCLEELYKNFGLKKAYFSAFDAQPFTPLENSRSIPLVRENFLYRIDWLLRFYHFSFKEAKEMVGENGMLPLNIDPKINFALAHKELFPVDVNEASFEELLRVPGVGLTSAQRIMDAREEHKIKSAQELKNFGVVLKKSLPFLDVAGKQTTLGCFA